MLLFLRLALRSARASGFPHRQGIGFLCGFSSLAVAMTSSSVLQSAVAQIVIWLFVGVVAVGELSGNDYDG
jgi:hypothetical protein